MIKAQESFCNTREHKETKGNMLMSTDVLTRISQKLNELDEADLQRAEKYVVLLLAEKKPEQETLRLKSDAVICI